MCGWQTKIHRSLQHSIHKETCSNTHRNFKSCSQKRWHYTIWFNLISPQYRINIIWLIWYSKPYLCSCSWSDLCCHFTGSWKVPVGLDLTKRSTVSGSPECHTAWPISAPYLSKTLDDHSQAASGLSSASYVPCIRAQHWCGFCPLQLLEIRQGSRGTGYYRLMTCLEQIMKGEL